MITFGIISTRETSIYLGEVIESIRRQNLRPGSFEILIVGNVQGDYGKNCRIIYFDDSIKPGWITKKKISLHQKQSRNLSFTCMITLL